MQNELLRVRAAAEQADSRTYRAYAFESPPRIAALSSSCEAEPQQVGSYHQSINVALWYRAALRSEEDGAMLALTSPLYVAG